MKYGLIGKSVKNSFSKHIHEMLDNKEYECVSMDEDSFIKLLKSKDFKGLNVTMPYKQIALEFVDKIDKKVESCNALNTIVNKNNVLYGYNTDYDGFLYLLKYYHIDVKDKVIAILGTGGASNTIKQLVKDLNCKEVYLITRNKLINNDNLDYHSLNNNGNKFDIIINATPNGMDGHGYNKLVDLDNFTNLEWVIDIIYNPLHSPLLIDARRHNINIASGLIMLVAQACYAHGLFFDTVIDDDLINKTYQQWLFKIINLVLIGMPGVGKSTIASKLANKFNKTLISTDEIIENQEKMSINDIFNNKGETYFRTLETDIVDKYSNNFNQVISTGGGVILNKNNMDNLSKNGIIIFINRDLDKIIIDNNRPLLKNDKDLKTLYEKRINLYNQYSDLVVDNNTTIEKVVERIEELVYEKSLYLKWS